MHQVKIMKLFYKNIKKVLTFVPLIFLQLTSQNLSENYDLTRGNNVTIIIPLSDVGNNLICHEVNGEDVISTFKKRVSNSDWIESHFDRQKRVLNITIISRNIIDEKVEMICLEFNATKHVVESDRKFHYNFVRSKRGSLEKIGKLVREFLPYVIFLTLITCSIILIFMSNTQWKDEVENKFTKKVSNHHIMIFVLFFILP